MSELTREQVEEMPHVGVMLELHGNPECSAGALLAHDAALRSRLAERDTRIAALEAALKSCAALLVAARALSVAPAVLCVADTTINAATMVETEVPVTQEYIDEVWNDFLDALCEAEQSQAALAAERKG